MAMRDLVNGGAACAVPCSSSSSNPLGALTNALLGSSSKTQAVTLFGSTAAENDLRIWLRFWFLGTTVPRKPNSKLDELRWIQLLSTGFSHFPVNLSSGSCGLSPLFENRANVLKPLEQSGSLAVRDFSNLVKPDDIVASEHLVTLLAVVPKYSQKDLLG